MTTVQGDSGSVKNSSMASQRESGGVHGSSTIQTDAGRQGPQSQSQSSSNAQRDLLEKVPLYPTEGSTSNSTGRRAQQRHRQRCAAERVVNDMVRALDALGHGSVRPATPFGSRVRPDRSAVPSPEVEGFRRVFLQIAEEHLQRVGPETTCARAALGRLTKEGLSYNQVARGDVVPAAVEKIALPCAAERLRAETVGGVAADLLTEWERTLLKDPQPSKEEILETRAYGDPALRGKALLQLGVRMWRSGMLKVCRKRCSVGVRMFTVHKKEDAQRLVFDLRRVNQCFVRPWPCSLGSLTALSGLDLSEENIGAHELRGLVGDVPDMFYRIGLPAGMAGFFWIEGLDAEELFHALAAEGIAAPELVDGRIPASERGVGMAVLPMGWSWAPFIAQNVLETVLIGGVPEFTADGAMRHGQPPPEFGVDNPVAHLEYIDDFGAIVLEPAGVDVAHAVQERARGALCNAGLDVHKEALGRILELLGAEIHLERRLVLPKAPKFALVIRATQHVAETGWGSPWQVEVLLGHWTHYALLQRMIFAVMDGVYEFVRCSEGSAHEICAVPEVVRQELRMLVALAPLIRADLALPWCRVVSMVDAGPRFGAVVYTEMERAEVAREGRLGLSGAWANAASPVPAAWGSRSWRLGPRQEWHTQEHNNITEGRCILLAVKRLTRCQKGRNCRMLVVTDSQVALGCFRKGRSSNRGLLHLARRLAGLVLGYNLRLSLRYVPSHCNLADGPSRGSRRVGVARSTARKAALNASTRP